MGKGQGIAKVVVPNATHLILQSENILLLIKNCLLSNIQSTFLDKHSVTNREIM